MADAGQVTANAISALLTGLSRALVDAQEAMSESPPVDAFGRPLPTYQIPHLDFQFEIETVRTTTSSGGFLGFAIRPSSSAPTEKVSSNIQGRLVAVPPNNGLPRSRILITQSDTALGIQLMNTAGEVLVNTLVELEFDPAASDALFDTSLTSNARLQLLDSRQATTDIDGTTSVGIKRTSIPSGKQAVILVRAAGAETRVAVARELAS